MRSEDFSGALRTKANYLLNLNIISRHHTLNAPNKSSLLPKLKEIAEMLIA